MTNLKNTILPIIIAMIWISISEFVRNELLIKSYWINHYENLRLTFPSEPINNMVWGLWSLLVAIGIYAISKKFSLKQTTLLSWFIVFVLMWLVVGNMGFLPSKVLYFAIPLSIIEIYVATLIIFKFKPKVNH